MPCFTPSFGLYAKFGTLPNLTPKQRFFVTLSLRPRPRPELYQQPDREMNPLFQLLVFLHTKSLTQTKAPAKFFLNLTGAFIFGAILQGALLLLTRNYGHLNWMKAWITGITYLLARNYASKL